MAEVKNDFTIQLINVISSINTFDKAHAWLAPLPRPSACGDGGFTASLSRKRRNVELQEYSDQATVKLIFYLTEPITKQNSRLF